jgi:exopolysaccharide biosynthesis WecB/TagA/CpsF family protein
MTSGGLEATWASNLADCLIGRLSATSTTTVTWLNHVSAMTGVAANVDYSGFDYVGIDGVLLRSLLDKDGPRTSADLVLPLLLDKAASGLRVALIGSTSHALERSAAVIGRRSASPIVVYRRNGYDEMIDAASAALELTASRVDLVIVGLGAPRQDQYVLDLAEHGVRGVILTCGGWLDQVHKENYYPWFAYPLRLNWLFRLCREPRRLWRRYSIDGVRAIRSRQLLRARLLGSSASALHRAKLASESPPASRAN